MSCSKENPEVSYPYFYTSEKFTSMSKKLGVSRSTLKRWWVSKFGQTAFEDRFDKRTKQTPEEVRKKDRDNYRCFPAKSIVSNARQRAKKVGVPFDITVQDVLKVMPPNGKCPITGLVLEFGSGIACPNSLSLDRILPELGYVRGNIRVISHLANTIKQDCTDPEVFCRLAEYLERHKGIK
jgi:hypothetical protein